MANNKTPMVGSGQVHGRAVPGKKAPPNASSVPAAHGSHQNMRGQKTDPTHIGKGPNPVKGNFNK